MGPTNDLRPRVADLVFHLYDRPLHPELFDTLAVRSVSREHYRVTARVTRTGHVITWEMPGRHLTEVSAAGDVPLPVYRSLIHRKMQGEHSDTVTRLPGLKYQSCFQVESPGREVFRHVHDEIVRDGLTRGLLHNFRPNHRLELAPLGLIKSDAWAGTIVFSTFHTFPAECTIVKTQTLIEFDR